MTIPELSLQILPGGITLDSRTGEVCKDNIKINLPDQLFRLLALVGARANEIVTREEIRQSLWSDSFVNFDDSINTAVRRLRRYLFDLAGSAPTIETIPGHGYRFSASNEEPSAVPASRDHAQEIDKPRLAVLPFDNLSGDAREEYLASSLTDAVITALAKIPALYVKPRCVVISYKQLSAGLAVTRKKLKVDAVLHGSVVHFGGRLRVTAQLLSVSTEEHLWADSYICDSGDILDFQTEIADRIAAQVVSKLAPAWKRRPAYVPPKPITQNAHLKAPHTFQHG